MRDYFIQIVLFLTGIVVGVMVPLLPKSSLRWIGIVLSVLLISISSLWIGYELGLGESTPTPPKLAPRPANAHTIVDFEESTENWWLHIAELKLGPENEHVCAEFDSQNPEQCKFYPANEKLSWGQTGFTGEHGLEILVELLGDIPQVYSISRCWEVEKSTDVISTKVFIPAERNQPEVPAINPLSVHLLARPKDFPDGIEWPWNASFISQPGWQHLTLDVREVHLDEENVIHSPPIACFHIDLYVPASPSQNSEFVTAYIDDIEFFK